MSDVYNIDVIIDVLQTIRAHTVHGSSGDISYEGLAHLLSLPSVTELKQSWAQELADYYHHPRIKWLSVEGVIGAGKSSLLAALMKRSALDKLQIAVFQVEEPVHAWERSGMLKAFYADPVGEAALFQNYAFATRIGKLSQTYKVALNYVLNDDRHYALLITERSPETDRDVFAYLQHKGGAMSDRQHAAYLDQHRAWKLAVNELRPDLYVWLDTPVSEAQRRTAMRARPGENVPETYAEALQQRHETLMSKLCYCSAPVVRLDGVSPFLTDPAALEAIGTEIIAQVSMLFPSSATPPLGNGHACSGSGSGNPTAVVSSSADSK